MKNVWAVALVLALTSCDSAKADFLDSCKRTLEARLRTPSTASYGALKDAVPSARAYGDGDGYMADGGTRLWLGYVDSDNAFGATERTAFACQQTQGAPVEVITTEARGDAALDELLRR